MFTNIKLDVFCTVKVERRSVAIKLKALSHSAVLHGIVLIVAIRGRFSGASYPSTSSRIPRIEGCTGRENLSQRRRTWCSPKRMLMSAKSSGQVFLSKTFKSSKTIELLKMEELILEFKLFTRLCKN